MDINALRNQLREFAKERDWDQFHSPKNLSMALAAEAGELLDIFQWIKEEESLLENITPKNLEKAREEVADIFLYLIRVSDKLDINLEEAVELKINQNKKKYPIELSKGNAIKYNRRNE